MRVFGSVQELGAAVGEHLGHSGWREIGQPRVDGFADATDDHQWIHVDPDRAAAGPFGGPIAHGFLTLSLLPALAQEVYRVEGVTMGVNYGLNKVRFPAPVPVGSRVRGAAELVEVTEVAGGVQLVVRWTVEIEGAAKPACVADFVTRQYVGGAA